MSKNAFFMTHHSPVGAWSSFTFGLPGKGVSIDHETPSVTHTADFLVAVSRGPGNIVAFPFLSGLSESDEEINQISSNAKQVSDEPKNRWNFLSTSQINRNFNACVDEYLGGDISLKVYTPHPSIPDPDSGASLKYATCPGILMEFTIDNTEFDDVANGFIGLDYQSRGRIHAIDWSSDEKLSGIAFSNDWAMAAKTVENKVFTICRSQIIESIENAQKAAHSGNKGGIMFVVPPRKKESIFVSFGFYNDGNATQGINSKYYFTNYFSNVEDVCNYILDNAQQIKNECIEYDNNLLNVQISEVKKQIFSQSVRAYYASTQLIEANGKALYNVSEGAYLWRNTLDLAADHLPYELHRNPWVVRNIMDLFIERYTYKDEIKFKDNPNDVFPGGLSFTHDMGNYTTYSPKGRSGYETKTLRYYSFMTTEELLNGIYCIAGYAISTKDIQWAKKNKNVALDLLASMENRDNFNPKNRNGILKGETTKCEYPNDEITTYDALDHSLKSAVGNLYISVKTLCSTLMLEEYFSIIGETELGKRARSMADLTAESLCDFYDEHKFCFKANCFEESESKVIAAIEPFAVPIFLGLEKKFCNYDKLIGLFKKHISTCLTPSACIDAISGGLRLSSTSKVTWVSKAILSAFVMESMFGIDFTSQYPTIMREFKHWVQVSAKEETISDQINCENRLMLGGRYYPRIITSFLWVNPKL